MKNWTVLKKIIDKGLDKIKQLGKLARALLKGKLYECRKEINLAFILLRKNV
ncbi:hypothetical protein A5880_002689 [Enterococcus sp. 4G2_DIV0659]|uniref:Uncharacterized protein n=1 Tax=Candidatus Enterococcus mansonii TaxID=1834181 RepID=A0A242CI36_9ENTE|nr:hypothetical protein A5880_000587 [Enterococcus sp. 4G2_DIV0659]